MSNQLEQIKTDQLVLGWYCIKPYGIILYKEDPENQPQGKTPDSDLICMTPMVPTAILQNIDTKEQKIELTYAGQKQTEHVMVDRETLVNKNKVVSLAKYGIAVGSDNASKVAAYFNNILGRSASKLPVKLSKSTLGWIGKDLKHFMPFSDGFVLDNAEDPNVTAMLEAMKPKGDRDAWFKRMGELRKHIPVRVTMAAAFASVLVDPVGQNSFVVYIWGGTGLGKTLLLRTTMSIWGDPNSSAIVRSLNTTENAMMQHAGFLKHIPFAGDELQTIKTRYSNYDKIIMDITEGINRGRLASDSKQREIYTWRSAFIFCGEEPIIKSDSGGGASVRVVEIELTQKYVEDGNELANFLTDNYGFAAREFIEALAKPVGEGGYDVKELYRTFFAELAKDKTLNEKQIGNGALLMTGDFIASSLFWQEPDMTVEDMKPFLKTADQVDVAERAYKYVTSMVVQYGQNFTEDAKEVWGRFDEDDDAVYILKSVLSERMQRMGFDFEACKKKWDEKGYIKRNKVGRLQHYTSISGHKAYCICVSMPAEPEEIEIPAEFTDHTGAIPW